MKPIQPYWNQHEKLIRMDVSTSIPYGLAHWAFKWTKTNWPRKVS